MTALRAPTGGSSDGGDDDASAETVSDHGDSLREIALLIGLGLPLVREERRVFLEVRRDLGWDERPAVRNS